MNMNIYIHTNLQIQSGAMLVQLQISHTLQAGSCNSLRLTYAENSSVIPAALHVGGLTQGVEAERVEKLRRRGRTAEVRAASSSLGAGGGRTRGRRDDELSLRVWMHTYSSRSTDRQTTH